MKYILILIVLTLGLSKLIAAEKDQNIFNNKGELNKFVTLGIKESVFDYDTQNFPYKQNAQGTPISIIVNNYNLLDPETYLDSIVRQSKDDDLILILFALQESKLLIHTSGKYLELEKELNDIAINYNQKQEVNQSLQLTFDSMEPILENFRQMEKDKKAKDRWTKFSLYLTTLFLAYLSGKLVFKKVNKRAAVIVFVVFWIGLNLEIFFLSNSWISYSFLNVISFFVYNFAIPGKLSLVNHDNYPEDDYMIEQQYTKNWEIYYDNE